MNQHKTLLTATLVQFLLELEQLIVKPSSVYEADRIDSLFRAIHFGLSTLENEGERRATFSSHLDVLDFVGASDAKKS